MSSDHKFSSLTRFTTLAVCYVCFFVGKTVSRAGEHDHGVGMALVRGISSSMG